MEWKENVGLCSSPPPERADGGIAGGNAGCCRSFDFPTTSLSDKLYGDEPIPEIGGVSEGGKEGFQMEQGMFGVPVKPAQCMQVSSHFA